MSVSIKTVETKAELKAFVKFPLDLYKGCPYYVPNLYQRHFFGIIQKSSLQIYPWLLIQRKLL